MVKKLKLMVFVEGSVSELRRNLTAKHRFSVLMDTGPSPDTVLQNAEVMGEIERGVAYEQVRGFWTIERETFKEDFMPDDQALTINVEGKGLVIVYGCGHSGVINTIRTTQKVTGTGNVYAVLGGPPQTLENRGHH